jgi:hypothetical protein
MQHGVTRITILVQGVLEKVAASRKAQPHDQQVLTGLLVVREAKRK